MKRSAAPFRLDIQPSPGLQWLVAVAAALAVLAVALAVLAHFPQAHYPRLWLLLCLPPLGGWWAWANCEVAPRYLRWDGQIWHLHDVVRASTPSADPPRDDEAAAVQLDILFDLGFWMLLRARRAPAHALSNWRAAVYLPLLRSSHAANWTQLRAALYCSRQSL